MRKWFFLICFLGILFFATGCGMSTNELAEEVKTSMLETWAKEPETRDVKIDSLILVHESGSKYNGVLQVSQSGEKLSLTVDVTYDGENMIWQIKE